MEVIGVTEVAIEPPVGDNRRPASPVLVAVSVVIAAVFALPGLYVVWRAIGLGADLGDLAAEVGHPLWRTIQLAVLVSASAAVLGTMLAWLVVRTDLPGRSVWRLLAPLPLVFPTFVGAA